MCLCRLVSMSYFEFPRSWKNKVPFGGEFPRLWKFGLSGNWISTIVEIQGFWSFNFHDRGNLVLIRHKARSRKSVKFNNFQYKFNEIVDFLFDLHLLLHLGLSILWSTSDSFGAAGTYILAGSPRICYTKTSLLDGTSIVSDCFSLLSRIPLAIQSFFAPIRYSRYLRRLHLLSLL